MKFFPRYSGLLAYVLHDMRKRELAGDPDVNLHACGSHTHERGRDH